jgi:hypothetical protein
MNEPGWQMCRLGCLERVLDVLINPACEMHGEAWEPADLDLLWARCNGEPSRSTEQGPIGNKEL